MSLSGVMVAGGVAPKYNHTPFAALPTPSEQLVSRNLCVIVLSALALDLFGFVR